MVFGISKIHTNADFTFSNNSILPISAIGIDIILKDAILQLEVHQPKRIVSQKKR